MALADFILRNTETLCPIDYPIPNKIVELPGRIIIWAKPEVVKGL
jgi:hypothetical protein